MQKEQVVNFIKEKAILIVVCLAIGFGIGFSWGYVAAFNLFVDVGSRFIDVDKSAILGYFSRAGIR